MRGRPSRLTPPLDPPRPASSPPTLPPVPERWRTRRARKPLRRRRSSRLRRARERMTRRRCELELRQKHLDHLLFGLARHRCGGRNALHLFFSERRISPCAFVCVRATLAGQGRRKGGHGCAKQDELADGSHSHVSGLHRCPGAAAGPLRPCQGAVRYTHAHSRPLTPTRAPRFA